MKIMRNEYPDIKCPYCNSKKYLEPEDNTPFVEDFEDGDKSICTCYDCNKIFTIEAEIEIIRETYYYTSEMVQPEDIIKDLPGQSFIWEDLDLGGIDITKSS